MCFTTHCRASLTASGVKPEVAARNFKGSPSDHGAPPPTGSAVQPGDSQGRRQPAPCEVSLQGRSVVTPPLLLSSMTGQAPLGGLWFLAVTAVFRAFLMSSTLKV